MSLNGLTLFQQMEQKLGWLSARQNVLAQNVANAETPGYNAKDLKPFSFGHALELAEALPVARTNPAHFAGGSGASPVPVVETDTDAQETSPDGNRVSVEEQMMKVADTGMEYQTITGLYRKQLGLLKTALGRGGTSA